MYIDPLLVLGRGSINYLVLIYKGGRGSILFYCYRMYLEILHVLEILRKKTLDCKRLFIFGGVVHYVNVGIMHYALN